MLRGISNLLSPALINVLMEMGHGDELLIADGNYPMFGCPNRILRYDGHGTLSVLKAIIPYFPLDTYVDHPTILMAVVPGDPTIPEIWDEYRIAINNFEKDGARELIIDKYEFYDRGKKAYAAIKTSDIRLYANIILKKGVIVD